MPNYNFTIGERLRGIQDDGSSFDRARKIGGGISRTVGELFGAYRQDKEAEQAQAEKAKAEQNKERVQAIIQEYNDPNSPEYEGMLPAQRALKVARLLYPLDQSMSQRYEDYSRTLQQTEGKYKQEQAISDAKVEARSSEKMEKKLSQKEAESVFNEAVSLWRKDPENQALKDNVNLAHGKAQTAGLKLVNPVEQQIRQKAIEFNQGIQSATLDLQKAKAAWDQVQDEKRNDLDQKKLSLALAEFANKADEAKKKQSGSTLPSETVAKISNLQTVLESLENIEQEIQNYKTSGFSFDGLRSGKYAIDLAVENLGRVQSGGAISADEVRNFKNLISPSLLDVTDNGDQYLRNVQNLKNAINNKITNLSSEGRAITNQNAGKTITNAPFSQTTGTKNKPNLRIR